MAKDQSWIADLLAASNVAGPPGAAGPIAASVANPAALTALSTAALLPFSQAAVQSLKRAFQYDPTSIAIPDGGTNPAVIAAQGGGNWIALPGVGVLGRSVSGTSTFGEFPEPGDPLDWTTVAAGQTATVYSMPVPALGFGEQAKLAADVQVQTAAPLIAVLSATGNGVTPIVLTVGSTATLQTGSLVSVSGVLGNTAANTVIGVANQAIIVVDATHISLTGTTGNGAYTSGGAIMPLDFGDWTVSGTYRNCYGTVVNSQNGIAGQDLTTPAEPLNATAGVAATAVSLTVVGGLIAIRVTAPAGTGVRAAAAGSYVRRPIPGGGPAPIITSIGSSSGPANGLGSIPIVGSHFTGTTSVYLVISGTVYPCSFSVVNDSSITAITSTGPAFGGVADLVVITGNGIATDAAAYTYVADPLSIMGGPTIVKGWYDQSSLQHTGAVCTAWNDKSGNTQHMTAVGSPVYTALSTNVTPNGPTATLDGSTMAFQNASFTLGTGGVVPLFVWVISRVITSPTSFQYMVNVYSSRLATNDQVWTGYATSGSTFATKQLNNPEAIVGTMNAFTGFGDGVNGTSAVNCSVANHALQTGTIAAAGRDGALQILSVGCNNTHTANFANIEVCALVVCNVQPTTQQRAALEAYGQSIAGVP